MKNKIEFRISEKIALIERVGVKVTEELNVMCANGVTDISDEELDSMFERITKAELKNRNK
jgi:hypothetical protein